MQSCVLTHTRGKSSQASLIKQLTDGWIGSLNQCDLTQLNASVSQCALSGRGGKRQSSTGVTQLELCLVK